MFRRHIALRICKYQHFANFCKLGNGKPSLENSETEISLSKIKPVSSKERTEGKASVISYLMDSCGLSAEKAISASGKVHFDSPDRPNAVLSFLKKRGFSKTQIAELVWSRPRVLVSNPEKTLLPKIEFLLHCTGISETDILEAIVRHPTYLARSLENQLAPVFGYVKDIIGAKKVAILLRRGSCVFDHGLENRLIPNVELLKELGVPKACMTCLLYHYPDVFPQKHDQFKKIVAEVLEMGFNPLKTAFVLALHARSGKGNKGLWDQCYETYSKWGWSKDEIHMAFRKQPNCMLLSEQKISRFLDFVVKMGRESRSIAQIPSVILYSMENRVIPRCSILHHLSSKGFIKEDWSLTSVLCPSEKDFLIKYVTKYHKELPQLLEIYEGKTKGCEVNDLKFEEGENLNIVA